MPASRPALIEETNEHESAELVRAHPRHPRLAHRVWRLLWGPGLVLFTVPGLLNLLMVVLHIFSPDVFHQDFLATYVLVRTIRDGADPYLSIQTLASQYVSPLPYPVFPHPTPHPPTLGLLLWPLGLVEYVVALRLVVVIEFACLVAAIFLIGRLTRYPLSPLVSLGLAIMAVAWRPVSLDLASGQVQLVILALLVGAVLAFQKGRPRLGGLLIGLTLLIKPILAPVLLLLPVRRQWWAMGSALATALAGYAVAGMVLGAPTLVTYVTQVVPEVSALYRNSAFNLSLWSLFNPRYFDEVNGLRFATVPSLGAAPGLLGGAAVVPLGVLLATLLLCRRMPLPWALSAMACASIVLSPIAWSFYLVLTILPIGQAARWLVTRQYPRRETILMIAVIVNLLVIPHALWFDAAFRLAGRPWPLPSEGIYLFPSGAGLVTFGPTLAVIMLSALTAMIGLKEAKERVADQV